MRKREKKANLLDESDKLYETLFNSISHELRTPLATIIGVADNLEDHLKPYHLDIEIPLSMPLVKLDVGLMEQVLHNLICNSCQSFNNRTTCVILIQYLL
jgi:K+-sensing histidine kinase KdpD